MIHIRLICICYGHKLIGNSHSVKRISVLSKEFKTLQYADDKVLFLDSTAASLRNVLHVHILDSLVECSGLKINMQKANAIWIGAAKCNEDIELDKIHVNHILCIMIFFVSLVQTFILLLTKFPIIIMTVLLTK